MKTKNETRQEGKKKVKEFLESELEDYSYFDYGEIKVDKGYEQTEQDTYYEVDIKKGAEEETTLGFHYDKEKDLLEVLLGEDTFEEINDYDYKVKYFWMALLKW